jgi:hypothetical protein
MLARQRASMTAIEERLEDLLAEADQGMVNAFTSGFRVSQTQLAVGKALSDPKAAAAALESAQVVALAILVREEMDPAAFEAVYRPFATVLPGPNYEPPPPVDRQIAAFLSALPSLAGEAEAEAAVIAKVLSDRTRAGTPNTGLPDVIKASSLDPAANYAAAWKLVVSTAGQLGRSESFRAVQESAEQAAPHDGLGIVGFAGVAAGGIFMRDELPIEKMLLLYEPFASAIPYESLR